MLPEPKLRDSADGETGEDGDQDEGHDAGADLGFGNATEEGEHRIPVRMEGSGRFRGGLARIKRAPLRPREA